MDLRSVEGLLQRRAGRQIASSGRQDEMGYSVEWECNFVVSGQPE